MINKTVLHIEIPAGCTDPVEVVRSVINTFLESDLGITTLPADIKEALVGRVVSSVDLHEACKLGGTFEYPIRALTDMDMLSKLMGDVNIEDAYPKPGEPYPYTRGCTPGMIIVDDTPHTNEGKENVADLNEAPKIKLNELCPRVENNGIMDDTVAEDFVKLDVKINKADLANAVTYDGVVEYTPLIRQWAEDRNIIGGGSSTLDQFIKGLTEAGELWTHVGKGQHALLKDDIGDVYVCLVNTAGNLDIKLEEHVKTLTARHLHGGRAAYLAKGLKRYSLQVLHTMANVAAAIDNILDADNDSDVAFFKLDFCEACADVVYVLETIALEHDWSLTECIAEAYNDIKDRKGLMVNGAFVKEKDFTPEMVRAALDDEATKPGTLEYLNEWLQKNPVEAVAPAVKEPFWKIWNRAQGNLANLAPFELTDETIALSNRSTDTTFLATLGVFGVPNHNGDVFVLDSFDLKARLDAMVGSAVGEVENPKPQKDQSITSWVNRIMTIDQANSAGILLGYAINELGSGEYGPVIEVVGLIEPSAFTKDRVATAGNAYFGVRTLTKPSLIRDFHIKKVIELGGFDLSIENPRVPK